MMFKLLIIQQYYNLSDDQMEYQLTDRLCFRNFLGLDSGVKIPDAKTIWLYNDRMSKAGGTKRMFDKFTKYLNDKGFYLNAGQMMDASFVEVSHLRNTITSTSVHDSQETEKLLDERDSGQDLFADSAYVGETIG